MEDWVKELAKVKMCKITDSFLVHSTTCLMEERKQLVMHAFLELQHD